MSTSSSEEDSRVAGHPTTSGLVSTRSLLFYLPSDSSDVQTEITPPTSPAPSEGKMHTPSDVLGPSRWLEKVPALALPSDSNLSLAKLHRQHCHHRASLDIVPNDEAGYDADGDGDDGDGAKGNHDSAGTTRLFRRPAFLRIDTRQHRRVASLLATRRVTSPQPGFEDAGVQRPLRAKLAVLSSTRWKPTASSTAKAESYELRRRPKAEPIGLGIGFPENHPIRSRAFSVPIPTPSSPAFDQDEIGEEKIWAKEQAQVRRSGYLPSGLQIRSKQKTSHVGASAPSPTWLALRPALLEVSPSPIECLPARAGGGLS